MEHQATYSPEDNKLRLYAAYRLDEDEYQALKGVGFKWARHQQCFVCPRWTPQAEDELFQFVDEIDDEDYSPEERSADRAERFGGYRDRRRGEAEGRADAFEAGPAVFGHQSRARAERQAARHDRHRVAAVSQWSKAEYWQTRTAGVIRHALHKSSAPVRRSRIKRLEAGERKLQKELDRARELFDAWNRVSGLPGADVADAENPDATEAGKLAYTLANHFSGCRTYHHPRREPDPEAFGNGRQSLYSLLTDPEDPITPREAAAFALEGWRDPGEPGGLHARWLAHYALRLTYERAMLEVEGGSAGAVEMEPGGWIQWRDRWPLERGRYQIQKVNKSRVTGAVTSVMVEAPNQNRYDSQGREYGPDNPRPLVLHKLDVTRLGSGAYTPPTEEEAAAVKAAKTRKPKAPPLVNPTDEDAARLQALWNGHSYHEEVTRITQAKYSRWSRGDMAQAVAINANGRRSNRSSGAAVFRIRIMWRMGADSVVVLEDKPQKPLPLDWDAIEAQAEKVTA